MTSSAILKTSKVSSSQGSNIILIITCVLFGIILCVLIGVTIYVCCTQIKKIKTIELSVDIPINTLNPHKTEPEQRKPNIETYDYSSSINGNSTTLTDIPDKLLNDLLEGKQITNDQVKTINFAITAPWCSHCTHLKPVLQKMLTEKKIKTPLFAIQEDKVGAKKASEVLQLVKSQGYPTIIQVTIDKDGKQSIKQHEGGRDENSLMKFFNQ